MVFQRALFWLPITLGVPGDVQKALQVPLSLLIMKITQRKTIKRWTHRDSPRNVQRIPRWKGSLEMFTDQYQLWQAGEPCQAVETCRIVSSPKPCFLRFYILPKIVWFISWIYHMYKMLYTEIIYIYIYNRFNRTYIYDIDHHIFIKTWYVFRNYVLKDSLKIIEIVFSSESPISILMRVVSASAPITSAAAVVDCSRSARPCSTRFSRLRDEESSQMLWKRFSAKEKLRGKKVQKVLCFFFSQKIQPSAKRLPGAVDSVNFLGRSKERICTESWEMCYKSKLLIKVWKKHISAGW